MKRLLFCIGLALPLAGLAQPSSSPLRPFIAFDDSVIALTHCILADVIGLKAVPDQTVILRGGVISAIGSSSSISLPKEARVVDCTGKSLLPGLVLMHEHLYYPAYSMDPFYIHFKQLPVTFPKLYLACGATMIRTAGSIEPFSDLALKRDIDQGKVAGPSMDLTAPYLENKGGFAPQIHELSGPEEAKAFVNFWANEGFTSFKAYNMLDKATLKAAIDAAHARGLKITGHLCSITYREAADLGIDQLEHGFFASNDFVPGKKENECVYVPDALATVTADSPAVKQLIAYLVSHKIILTSTLAVFQAYIPGDTSYRPEVLAAMAPDTREMFLNYYSRMRGQGGDAQMEKEMRMEKQFSDAGGLLTVGTDPTGNGAVLAGYGSQVTIELLVKEGFTPLQAIRIATYNGAKALGMENTIGSIQVGRRADLVVVDGDISKDITKIRRVQWVLKKGVAFDSKKLFESVKGQVGKF
jgi:imidazolonepropionase-like amidohydrolase